MTNELMVPEARRRERAIDAEAMRLPKSLSPVETWGFGLTGHLAWIGTAPILNAELGSKAIFVWLPAVIVGMLINLQVKRLGEHWSSMSGGTPNYTSRLLKKYPGLGRFAAIAYYLSWVAFIPLNATILAELIDQTLALVGIPFPKILFIVGFTLIPYIIAFSGSRALAILHAFFVIPAVGCLLLFGIQGFICLALSPNNLDLFPSRWSFPTLAEWVKWFLFTSYVSYSCESASSFVADSQRPRKTLQFLKIAAGLMPLILLGNTWVLSRLVTEPELGGDTFNNLFVAAFPFWGQSSAILVTLLIVSSSLIACATAVSNSPRMLYQLARDGYLAPVFKVVSPSGVLQPALIFSCLISIICLIWGDISSIIVVTGVSFLAAQSLFHLGLWLHRHRPEVWAGWLAGCLFVIEAVILALEGFLWSWQDLLLGLAIPIIILMVDRAIQKIPFALFRPSWWSKFNHPHRNAKTQDFVILQVFVLLVLLCGAVLVTWNVRSLLGAISYSTTPSLLVILVTIVAFVGVAIACWTSLPQVAAIAELQQKTEQRLITALETVPDTIFILDSQGIIKQTNKAAEALFDIPIEALVGLPLNQLILDLPKPLTEWSYRSEHTFLHPQAQKDIEMTFSQIIDGGVNEYLVILRDISHRKQAEQERIRLLENEQLARIDAEAAEEKASNILESITDGFFSVDNEWKLVYMNTQAETLLQKNREELLGKNLWSAFPEAVELPFYTESHKAVSEQVTVHFEAFYPPLNIYFECHSYPSQEGLSVYFRDVTPRKQAEANINRALEKEKELSALKSRFITTMSHEFRTPLATILSSTELVEHYGHKFPQDKKAELFQQVHISIKQMTKLLNDILAINKAESGKIEFNPAPLNLENFCGQLIKEIQLLAGEKHSINFNLIGGCNEAVMDEKLLRHIFTNLLSNALKYSPDGGNIEFSMFCQDTQAIFQVKDSGIGIPESELPKLFEEFHRASNVGNIGGTGLGLSIVKRMVDLHGGKITVESKINTGTTFTVTIPTAK